MKRLLPLIWMLLFLTPALAEDDPTALFLDAHPGYEIDAYEAESDIAAAILVKDDAQMLSIAERVSGVWTLSIESTAALRQDNAYIYEYEVFVDANQKTVSWRCQPWETVEFYSATLENGTWKLNPPQISCWWDEYLQRIILTWDNGKLLRTRQLIDSEGDSLVSSEELFPLPAPWLNGIATLDDFDANLLPFYDSDIPTTMFGPMIERAAKELLPGYTFIDGMLLADSMKLLMDRPDNSRIFVGVTYDGNWRLTDSTPMPKDAAYDQFGLTFPGVEVLILEPNQDGLWGVSFLSSWEEDYGLSFGNELIQTNDQWGNPMFIVGMHPWGDITSIDWTTLPFTAKDAWAMVDSSGWAMVDLFYIDNHLILHETPSQDGRYLGEYRAGTPIRVLERRDDWTKVDIFGVEGWMETTFLAFGSDMAAVDPLLRYLDEVVYTDTGDLDLCPTPDSEPEATVSFYDGIAIIGSYGDEWYHVYDFFTNQSGYVWHEPPVECV